MTCNKKDHEQRGPETVEYKDKGDKLVPVMGMVCPECELHTGPLWLVGYKPEAKARLHASDGPKPKYDFTTLHEPSEAYAELFGTIALEDDDQGGNDIYITTDDVMVEPVMCDHCGIVQARHIIYDEEEQISYMDLCDKCNEAHLAHEERKDS